jgi:NADH:ubiquinone oxidoreductase subunit 5 (subunit L)/multisubunit Na+/H+ antiporter MnhA subunit
VEWGLVYDSLTVSMLLPVIFVSALVQIYSLGYMESKIAFLKYCYMLEVLMM